MPVWSEFLQLIIDQGNRYYDINVFNRVIFYLSLALVMYICSIIKFSLFFFQIQMVWSKQGKKFKFPDFLFFGK